LPPSNKILSGGDYLLGGTNPLQRVLDQPDWTALVKQHGPMVWKTVYRLLNHDGDASDCFQNTFFSAWKFAQRETVRNWEALLRRFAVARALEQLRRRYRETSHRELFSDDLPVPSKAIGAEQTAEEREFADRLRRILSEIDHRQAQVFCLACLGDLDYRQIAEEMGLTVTNVGKLLNKARESLRKRLKNHVIAQSLNRDSEEI
jgi:RNA polymerase sigma-70 factor (ECF subfamily)